MNKHKITVRETILKSFPAFKGIKVETSNDFKYLLAESRTGHWKISLKRAEKQNQIMIVSMMEPGKVIIAQILKIIKSKKVRGRYEVFFSDAKVDRLKIGNRQLVFTQNPIGYF
jgi:hypothetical protein